MLPRLRFLPALLALLASALPALRADTLADIKLRGIIERQQTLFSDAAAQGAKLDQPSFHSQVELLCHEYESFLRENPTAAAGYADYGYLLWKVGMRREAAGVLLKANQLDPEIPMVKNELGNYLAEEGKPLDALNYFLSALKLAPDEPLYHYQLGTLLYEARDDFLKSGAWTADALDKTSHEAFKHAADLAPDRIEFTYRYAESFYDIANPNWDEALKVWAALESKAHGEVERQTLRLHEANIWIRRNQPDRAREILAGVTEPGLQKQKQKLVAALQATAGK